MTLNPNLNAKQQLYVTKMKEEQELVNHYLGKVRQLRSKRNMTVVRAVEHGILSYSQIAEALGLRKGAISAIVEQSKKENANA